MRRTNLCEWPNRDHAALIVATEEGDDVLTVFVGERLTEVERTDRAHDDKLTCSAPFGKHLES